MCLQVIDITNEIKKAQYGDKDALALLTEENQGLIWSIAKRFIGRGVDTEDIYQIVAMGFIKAIRNFDLNYEVKLSTYAVPYMIGEIKKFLRDDGPIKVSRSLKELNLKIKEIQKEYISKEGREPTISEISKLLKTNKEEITLALDINNPITSIEENIYNDNKTDNSISILDTISSNKDEQNIITNKIAINNIINELNPREKQLILLRYFKDQTQNDVAKILGISQVQVSRIEKKILNNMRKQLS